MCPLTLHTLPAEPAGSLQSPSDVGRGEVSINTPALQPSTKKEGIPNSTHLIPRLISVAEIIKREYLKKLDTSVADDNGCLSGLHQYNELGTLLPSGSGDDVVDCEERRAQEISRALSGKN